MFALPCHHNPSFVTAPSPFVDVGYHTSPSSFNESFLVLHELQRQQQIARQAQEEELIHRRRRFLEEQEQERQAELAFRTALIRKARREEHVYHQALARHCQAASEKQQRRLQEEQERVEALHQQQYRKRCSPQSLPSLLDTLFGGLVREQESPVDDANHSPADFADPPSPTLSASSVGSSPSFVDDSLSLSSAASSTADHDSDADSISTASSSATSVGAAASLSTLSRLASSFTSHRNAFVAPSSLSFQPSDGRSPSPPLAFTASNAPLLAYEEYLLSVLTQIDAVESAGDAEVRRQRKELVRAIEGELRRIDELKEVEWERQSGSGGSSGEEEEDVEMSSDEEEEEVEEENEQQPHTSHPIVPFALPFLLSRADSPIPLPSRTTFTRDAATCSASLRRKERVF